jgi:transcriptional regulator with XRE-family HTH domain
MYRNDKIRGKQAELGLSVEDLAERAGVNPNTVSAIRNGKDVRESSLRKVVTALGLSMADVYEQREEAEPVTAGA